jgi:agmatinase
MIFAGGDHAISFPLVNAYLRHFPDLVLLHLDAHNDLLFLDGVRFSHATPISSLLRTTPLAEVISLGLRTDVDTRVGNLSRIASDPSLASRVHLHSIGVLKRMASDRRLLETWLESVGPHRPCYLSIDLDVLSSSAMAGRVSTPAGPGLEWWELLEIVRALTRRLRVVACDVVELDLLGGSSGCDEIRTKLAALVLQLVHGLATQRTHTFDR